VLGREFDVELHGDRLDALDASQRALDGELLAEGVQVSAQGHHAILHGNADGRGVDGGVPAQLGSDITLQL